MIKIILVCLFLVLSSCTDYMFIENTLKQMVKLGKIKYNLECFGRGVSAPENINSLNVNFYSKQHLDCQDARKLIIDYTEDFIVLIKNSRYVKQYINNPPINEYKLSLLIVFKDINDDYDKELPAIYLSYGIITFYKLDQFGCLTPSYEENYADAFFKIYGTKPPSRYYCF